MKTLKFCLLLAFLASPIFIFSSFRPKPEPALQTTIHPDATFNRLRLVVNKPQDQSLTLRFLEADGWLLHEQRIPGGASTVEANLNLCALPNGTYRVEVSSPGRVQTHLAQLLASGHPNLKRQINVWPVP